MTPITNNANFVVHCLDKQMMPSAIEIIDESYRKEKAPMRSSSWCGLATASLVTRLRFKNKTLRIKQFLYDLGPSSTLGLGAFFDFYPWRIKVVALSENRPAWFGHDNKGRQALGFLSHLTSIQISAEESEYEKEDFIVVANAMSPSHDYANAGAKYFAELSYWSRFSHAYHNLTVASDYAVPTSLWHARWPIAARDAEVIWRAAKINTGVGQWCANSTYVKTLHDKTIETGEFFIPQRKPTHQIVYRRKIAPGVFAPRRPRSSQLPTIDAHSGFAGFRINVATGKTASYFIASCTEEHGPHDAIAWNKQGECTMVQASSMWGFSLGRFASLLGEMQDEQIELGNGGCLGR